jgi:hypothetical protein
MHRIRANVNFANVVSLVALFVALSASAYAAEDLIVGKDIKANSIKGKQVSEKTLRGVDVCPSNAVNQVGDVCFTGPQVNADWNGAVNNCRLLGLRLPSVGELSLVADAAEFDKSWTGDLADPAVGTWVASPSTSKKRAFTVGTTATSTGLPYRCISTATNPPA